MTQSLKSRLHSYLLRNFPRTINSGELERLAMDAGFKASNSSRRCRELENENKIEVSYEKGVACYRAKQEYVGLTSPKIAPKEIQKEIQQGSLI